MILNIIYLLNNSLIGRGNLSKRGGSMRPYHQNSTVCIKSFYCIPLDQYPNISTRVSNGPHQTSIYVVNAYIGGSAQRDRPYISSEDYKASHKTEFIHGLHGSAG